MVLLRSIMQIQLLTKVCFKLPKNLQMLCRIRVVLLLLNEVNAVYEFYVYTHIYVRFFSPVLQIGHIEGQPERKGVFPVSFVHILSD